jgi:predicted oxidoreductase
MFANSRLIYGTMGLGGGWNSDKLTPKAVEEAALAFEAALEIGIDYFDFADIYQNGKSESVFGEVLKANPEFKNIIKIQTKAGIILANKDGIGQFDFSAKHIINAAIDSLSRLNVSSIDSLLLHRPDPLMEASELKEAFKYLFENGLIKKMGVSNMNQYQIQYIEKATGFKVKSNQLQISLSKLDWLDGTIGVNNDNGYRSTFTPGLLEYMMLHDIEVQAWSPLSGGIFSGKELKPDTDKTILETKEYVYKLAEEKNKTPECIVLAFILKHPAQIRPVIGTSKAERIRNVKDAETTTLTRKEWYTLYTLSRGLRMP